MGEQAASAADELAIYDSVTEPPAGQVRDASSATAAPRPMSVGTTLSLLAVLLLCSLALLVGGLAMAAQDEASRSVTFTIITVGGCLVVWHLRALAFGSGRRTAMVNPWPGFGLLVTAGFGAVVGFTLFDLLTGTATPSQVALFSAGIAGLAAALATFSRDAAIRDRQRSAPRVAHVVHLPPDPEPAPALVNPTGRPDELHSRGVWPMPRRGTAADASMWDSPQLSEDQPAPPRRARRGE